MKLADKYFNDGYVVLPGVIKDYQYFRKEIQRLHQKTKNSVLEIDAIFDSGLWQIQFHPEILKICHQILGDFGFINDFNLQIERIDNSGMYSGWHFDANSEANNSLNNYLFSANYRFAKVGVYFQENDIGLGGGIDVIKGSHKLFQLPASLWKISNHFVHKCANLFGKVVRIPAGSVIIFDSRLLHRSTPKNFDHLPEKYAFYWEVTNFQNKDFFLNNAIYRALVRNEKFFTKYLSYCYPNDYPFTYTNSVDAADLSIFSLDTNRSSYFKFLNG